MFHLQLEDFCPQPHKQLWKLCSAQTRMCVTPGSYAGPFPPLVFLAYKQCISVLLADYLLSPFFPVNTLMLLFLFFFFKFSVQFSSVAQSCPTLCDPMNRSTPGLPVHHQLPEFTQTHVHRVGDAIQPFHPLSSPLNK